MDEITIEGKVYISSKQAAKITGYAKDYVGQLCREGRVEARHIGRNWYVLEDSIREHRFGAPEEKPVEVPNRTESVIDSASTWQRPQYVPETPAFVPSLSPKAPEVPVSTPAIADMQSAWKEWFEEKKPMEALPDGSEDFKDEYLPLIVPEPSTEAQIEAPIPEQKEEQEEMVVISRIQEEPETVPSEILEGEKVELHRSYTTTTSPMKEYEDEIVEVRPAPRMQAPVKRAPIESEEVGANNGVIRALLLVVALAAALIALIGTGNAEQLFSGTSLDFGAQKEVIDFLGGKSTYESSL